MTSSLFNERLFRETLPPEMLAAKRFMRFFLQPKPTGGTAKIPLGNHADESTWSTFEQCVAALEPGLEQGLGYAFFGGDIYGLDIDHCRNPKTGEVCPEAMRLLERLPSWAEFSVSGQGIHVLFKGNVRGKQLTETCLQFWNSKNSPRFFALTCSMVGDAFKTLKNVGEEFNYVFATARHISAKIREELRGVDYDQWAALPAERDVVETVAKEKSKTKSRKVAAGFDVKHFLTHYELAVDNECDNELGHCIRLTTCPLKGEAHAGHNSTTCNFIYPCKDGGLAFHCQSTGCVEYGIKEALEALEKAKGKYPKSIYEEKPTGDDRLGCIQKASAIAPEHTVWLWPGYLELNQPTHFGGASAEGKSPVTLDLAARVSSGADWPDGTKNELGPRSVFILAAEDDWPTKIIPRLKLAGANLDNICRFYVTQKTEEVTPSLDCDCKRLEDEIRKVGDVALVVIDPITNYLGSKKMNVEEEIRSGILMPLSFVARRQNCSIVTVGHLNKRGSEATVLNRLLGAQAFGGVMRSVFLFGKDPDEEDQYAHIMSEIRNKSAPKLRYSTDNVPVEWDGKTSDVLRVKWNGVSTADDDDVANAPKQKDKSITTRAVLLIKGLLRNGARRKAEIDQAMKENGIDPEKIEWTRIKKRCKAEARPLPGKGAGWEWYLATPEQAEFDGAAFPITTTGGRA